MLAAGLLKTFLKNVAEAQFKDNLFGQGPDIETCTIRTIEIQS